MKTKIGAAAEVGVGMATRKATPKRPESGEKRGPWSQIAVTLQQPLRR
jgi:hypothetical protein